jgi:FkbM family methyltransferase
MKALYGEFVRSDDLVFDVGGNVGNRTAIFLELGARAIVVEPQLICVAAVGSRFASESRVTIVPKALGSTAGEARILTSQAHGISSMSPDWVASVRDSGRFAMYRWDRTERVPVTTIDQFIGEYGSSAFCKLDVEGFESQVLGGLTTALPALSFECAPVYLTNAYACFDRLTELGEYRYNYNLNETMNLELESWVPNDRMRSILRTMERGAFADVYAKLLSA